MKLFLFSSTPMYRDIALLLLRMTVSLMMVFGHGMPKIIDFYDIRSSFPELAGLSPEFPLLVAIFSEVFCSMFIAIGFVTRGAAVPLIITMMGAAIFGSAQETYMRIEAPLLFLMSYFILFMLGPGRFSVDAILSHQHRVKEREEPSDPW